VTLIVERPVPTPYSRRRRVARAVAPGLVAAGCVAADRWVVGVSPLMVALVVGCLVANVRRPSSDAGAGQDRTGRAMLRLGVVLVGLRLSTDALAALGWHGLLVAGLTVGITFGVTCAVGGRLRLERGLVTLVAAGFSVCGAAAIAAVEGGVRRRDRDVALAVAMVTVFGTAMVVALPLAADLMDLSERELGVWAGASIHEVAQVVAAASVAGPVAVAIATTVKLARVALLPVVYVAAATRGRGAAGAGRSVPTLPWFVTGFLLAVAVRALGVLTPAQLEVADTAAVVLLAGGMYGLGLGLRARDLFPVPLRLVVLCTLSTLTAALLSLALTVTLT
jgi:uncharacterized integral membrane protein (TIGR00698 family)